MLVLALMVLLLCTSWSEAANEAGARIVGGVPVDISSVPYLVNLRIGGNFICGGSLVTNTHVVTAAHCVKGIPASRIEVVGGASLLTDATGVRRTVAKVYTPKAYSTLTLHSDVAVLKLSSAIQGRNIATISLCNSTWKAGELIKVSGWGQITESNKRVSVQVRSVEVALITRNSCVNQYKYRGTISTTMFCATSPGKDACDGDSGGPAVYQGQLCGIVSWGIGCGRRNSPGVYTSVKTVRSFIDKALKL